MTKNDTRRAKFQAIASEITETVRAWRDRLGDHEFEMKPMAVNDKSTDSQYEPCMKDCCKMLVRSDGGINSHFAGAPLTMTNQFERTIRRGQ